MPYGMYRHINPLLCLIRMKLQHFIIFDVCFSFDFLILILFSQPGIFCKTVLPVAGFFISFKTIINYFSVIHSIHNLTACIFISRYGYMAVDTAFNTSVIELNVSSGTNVCATENNDICCQSSSLGFNFYFCSKAL